MSFYAVHINEISLFVICLTDISAVYPIFRIVPLFSYFLSHSGREIRTVKALVAKLACVASVSVQFGSKETRNKSQSPRKNGKSKRAERGGEERKGFPPSSSPPPLSFFGCRPTFCAVKTQNPCPCCSFSSLLTCHSVRGSFQM